MQCQSEIMDFEDMNFDLFQFEQSRLKREKKVRKKIKIKNTDDQELLQAQLINFNQTYVQNPGSQHIYVKTFGCSHNISDSEFMMGQLSEYGYKIVDSPDQAQLILINSCTVKNPSQEAFINLVKKVKKVKKPLVVAGCVPQGQSNIPQLKGISVIGISQIDRVVQVVRQTLNGHSVQLLKKKQLPSLDLPKIRRNIFIQIIPINSGCLGSCTYCKTVHARGKLGSYSIQTLTNRLEKVLDQGIKQIWLTSQDTGAYGIDLGITISDLLPQLVKKLKFNIMMRIGMTNPPYILKHLETVAAILNHPNVYSFIHIPVQSANNQVLNKMNREYTVQQFQIVVNYLKNQVEGLTISTDIICGFPGQTAQYFQDTLRLINKYKFPILNISQFYSRPGTAAAKMAKVPSKQVKMRSSQITKLFQSYSKHQKLLGTLQQIWINDSEQKKGETKMIGHTKNYTKVSLPYNKQYMGKSVFVKIEKVFDWHVQGQIIREVEQECQQNDYYERLRVFEQKLKTINKNKKIKENLKNDDNIKDLKNINKNQNYNYQEICLIVGILLLIMGLLLRILK